MDEGHYKIYLDGLLNLEGFNLSKSKPITGKGIFVVGQEQDSVGGFKYFFSLMFVNLILFFSGDFSESESFVGKVSYLDFWDRALTAIEVNEYYRTCDPYRGSFVSWTDLKFKTVGTLKIDKSEFCKPCEQNLEIENANIIYGDQTAFVKCTEGFKLEGNPFLFCLRTSKWDLYRLPSCKIVKCEILKPPANGRMVLTKTSYKGTAKFTCDDGFKLTGSNLLSCTDFGKWSSEVPNCKSLYECQALKIPLNGHLVYATDSGIVSNNLSTYPLGTFAEIQCDEGFSIENENLISCTENGVWDFEIENCERIDIEIPNHFWQDLKEFLFLSCEQKKPKLCKIYSTEFDTDLTYFELPETVEYEGMDLKLFKLLTDIAQSSDLNAGSFLKTLLAHISDKSKIDAFRFVICLYVDLILIDHDLGVEISGELDGNINNDIKRLLTKNTKIVYSNYLKNQ